MKQIIIFPRGQLAPKDREKLTKAGIISLEADDPSKVVTVIPSAMAHRMDRIGTIGNGQVPAVAALAWEILSRE